MGEMAWVLALWLLVCAGSESESEPENVCWEWWEARQRQMARVCLAVKAVSREGEDQQQL